MVRSRRGRTEGLSFIHRASRLGCRTLSDDAAGRSMASQTLKAPPTRPEQSQQRLAKTCLLPAMTSTPSNDRQGRETNRPALRSLSMRRNAVRPRAAGPPLRAADGKAAQLLSTQHSHTSGRWHYPYTPWPSPRRPLEPAWSRRPALEWPERAVRIQHLTLAGPRMRTLSAKLLPGNNRMQCRKLKSECHSIDVRLGAVSTPWLPRAEPR